MQKEYAAGIMPFAVHGGEVLFLVGKDSQDGLWSDFGGKAELSDKSELETAQREFNEETCGAVVELRALKVRMAVAANVTELLSATQSRHPYHMFLVHLPFEPGSRRAFRRAAAFLRGGRFHRRFVEKADVVWVTWRQLHGLPLRAVFHATLARHQPYLQALAVTPGCWPAPEAPAAVPRPPPPSPAARCTARPPEPAPG